ncbi:MAG: transposase [Thermaerobacter sp.]|nr:transposase [Thermaerobacter sp.]
MWVMLRSEIARLNAEVDILRPLKAKVQELEAQVEALKARVCQLQRLLYGRKSEREKEEAAEAGEPEQPVGRRRGQQPGSPGHGRRRQLNLPTEEVIHDLPEGQRRCPSCGLAYEPTSLEDTSEEIDFRVTVKRVVHRRPLYRPTCSCSDQPGLVSAPAPGKVYPHCPYTPQTIAWLVLLKHLGSLPFNRILRLLRLRGLFLSPGSMVGMLGQVAILLAPLYEAFQAHCRTADRWHADETGWKVFIRPPGKASFRWWLWVFAAPDVVIFLLKPSRGAKVLNEFFGLEGPNPSRGILMTDMFSSYKAVLKFLVAAYCWAHMRRYFRDAGKNYPEQLAEWSRAWR